MHKTGRFIYVYTIKIESYWYKNKGTVQKWFPYLSYMIRSIVVVD